MHGEVQVSVRACMNDYLRCTKCEVHDRVHYLTFKLLNRLTNGHTTDTDN